MTVSCLRVTLFFLLLKVNLWKVLNVNATPDCILKHRFQKNYTLQYFRSLYLNLFTNRPPNNSYSSNSFYQDHFKTLPCGVMVHEPDSAIINGTDAPEKSWPWQTLVYSLKNFCGGVLLDNQWVLTAAHCFLGNLTYSVKLGSRKLESDSSDQYTARSIKLVVVHKGYDSYRLDNDIAMVKMSRPVNFTETVRPACLPTADVDFDPNHSCHITGFGEQRREVSGSRVLQELRVVVVPYRECVYLWRTLDVDIDWRHICVGRVNNRGGACIGDSGGPLSCKVGNRYYVAGVTSFGPNKCSSSFVPDTYTKISQFVDWIFYVMEKFRDT